MSDINGTERIPKFHSLRDNNSSKRVRKQIQNLKYSSKKEEKNKKKKRSETNQIKNDKSLLNALKHEWNVFCQSTTMRGFPRIVRTQSRNLQILWISFVVTLFIGLLLSMILLTSQFLEYSVIHPPVILTDKDPPFPSISVCNLRPLSRTGLDDLNRRKWRSPREFGRQVNGYAAKLWYYNTSTKHYYTQMTTAISMNGYLESVPFEYLDTLGHSLNELVIYCMVLYDVGSKREFDRCDRIGHWTKTIHALYLNCHTLSLNETIRNRVRSVYMYLYLDDQSQKTQCADCFLQELKSQLSGALAVLHTPDTYPDINQEAVNLQPGTLTEFSLKFILHKNKKPPYGRCSYDTQSHIKLHNYNYIYSELACQQSMMQKDVNDNCKCNVIEYPIFNASLPFCSSMKIFIPIENCNIPTNKDEKFVPNETCKNEMIKVYNNLGCKNLVLKNYVSDIVVKCTLPCTYYSYASERSTSSWPTKNFQLSWLNSDTGKALRNKPEFKPYIELIKLLKNGQEQEALGKLDKLNLLEKNLLGMMVNRPNNKVHFVEEKEVLSLTSYLSQIGGLCSVFVGLTMICVVEIIELFVHCFEAIRANKKKELKVKEEVPVTVRSELDLEYLVQRIPSKSNATIQCCDNISSSQNGIPPDYLDLTSSTTFVPCEENQRDLWVLQTKT